MAASEKPTLTLKSATERFAAVKAEAEALEKAAPEPTKNTISDEAATSIRAAAAAEERASVAHLQKAPEDLFVLQRAHMMKLEREEEARQRAQYQLEQSRQDKPQDDFDRLMSSGLNTHDAFLAQIKAQRAAMEVKEEPKPPQPTPAMWARTLAEMARGAERVKAAEAQQAARPPSTPDAGDGYNTPVFQHNPGKNEVFPTTNKAVSLK